MRTPQAPSATSKTTRKERRNLYIRIPEDHKISAQSLAERSNMTLDTYLAALVEDAIKNEVTFEFVRVRRPQQPDTPPV